MSLNVLTQGGGTGGESASIFVTGLSEADIVTATKGGKTVKGKWVSETIYKMKPLIPTMTSDTTPSGVASQMNTDGSLRAYMAFRGRVSTSAADCAHSSYGTSLPWYLGYEFEEEREISYFEAYFAFPDVTPNGSEGYISVSDNGSDWKQVTTFSGLVSGITHKIPLKTPVKCKYFRFYFTAYNNTYSSGSVRVGMIQAYGLVPVETEGFYISPIKSYGTWTVTATNGEKTTTQDVLVDAAVEFEIEMAYRLYLYREGDECEDVTGGWTASGYSRAGYTIYSGTKESDCLNVQTPSGVGISATETLFGTAEPVDLSAFTKLCIEYKIDTNNDWSPKLQARGAKAWADPIFDVYGKVFVVGTRSVVEADVMDISAERYIVWCADGLSAPLRAYNIWLE